MSFSVRVFDFFFFFPTLNKHLQSLQLSICWRILAGVKQQSRCPMSRPSYTITGHVSSHSVHTNKLQWPDTVNRHNKGCLFFGVLL